LEKTKEQWLSEALNHYKEERHEEALKACERALKIDPTFSRALHGKGLILKHQKRYKEALGAYDLVLEIDKENAKIYADKADLLYLLKDFSLAREAYQAAIHLDEKYEQVYRKNLHHLFVKARDLSRQNLIDQAITACEDALSFAPEHDFAKSTLSKLQKEKEQQKKYKSRFVRYDPPSEVHSVSYGRSHEAIENQKWNNQWQIDLSKVSPDAHPFNCRCKDCYNY
jgi:tetratricopeptide (TPR) repeat protein